MFIDTFHLKMFFANMQRPCVYLRPQILINLLISGYHSYPLILIPLCLLFEPQPKMLQFAPTIAHNGEKCAKITGGPLMIPIMNDAFVHLDFNNG